MINPGMLLKFSKAKEVFLANHPKFPLFLAAVQKDAIEEGTVVEIKVKKKDNKEYTTNVLLKESDIEMISELSQLIKQ